MSKAVLISIQPKWCELIVRGLKRIEVRKSMPKLERPFKCYIYCTNKEFNKTIFDYLGSDSVRCVSDGQGMVIGEFVCAGIMRPISSLKQMAKESCLTEEEILNYAGTKQLYGWRITKLKVYDKPKELGEFKKACNPQSWCYVEEI